MNKKIYIIVILAIIVTTLSQTVSFISGEHQFYQSVQDKCIKCHGDIKNQLSASTNHSSSSCNYCHVKSATNHTNTKPACQDCHNTTLKLSDSLEAHTDFSSMSSKGCIACHTTYNALVNYSRAEYIDYTITNRYGNWIISNITTIGTMNLSYNAQRTGGDHDVQNVTCKDCHEDIFEAVSLGGHAVVLAKNSTNSTNGTQVPYHDNSNTTLEAWCRTCHSRNDANFSTQQHSVRKTTCEVCHQAYNSTPHPGNFFTNINTVPHLYRSLVCISCHSIGWPAPGGGIHFKVHQEPYFDVTYEIIEPLLIINSTPADDPTTIVGTAQAFSITMNRPADIYWYNDGSEIFRALSVISSSYTSSNANVGVYNITAVADDGSATISRTWNWTITNQTGNGTGGGGGWGGTVPGGDIITGSATGSRGSNNISGYVFDNNVLALPGVLVQNSSYQNTTNISGYYSMTGLPNGTYTFSYSKAGFNTNYSIFTLNGATVENVNVIVYDTTPPASVSNINTTGGNFYINNTWINPADADFNNTWFRYDNGTTLQSVNSSTDYLNLTWSPHYTQNISAQTVDTYNNINPAKVWFNATVPNNAPVQLQVGNKTVDEGQPLNFTVSSTDADNDTITYGTNATKGFLDSTTGNFSWTPGYGDAGVYAWYFNSSDGFGGISTENIAVTVSNVPLSITNSPPVSDPATIVGSSQTFSITLNRTADVIWYNNGSEAFRVLNVTSATYINSTADVGIYNITAFANDSYDSVSRSWNWSVTPNINGTNVSGGGDGGGGSGGSTNSVSGYVSDNFGLSLEGVLVQNGSYQNTTDASGYYLIANLSNGTYNFSYSRAGFSTAYFEFTLDGAVVMNANRTLYDIMPAAPVSDPTMTTGNFYVNNTWVNPADADFNYTWFRYDNGTTLQNVSKPVNYLNLTWQPHYTQNISAQTVDTSGNVNQTMIWFNTTIPNNAPFQYSIGNKVVNENENLQFTVIATDVDSDTITYGTNATKGSFNTTTGNFSWTPGYGDSGTYFWYFNSSDDYGGVATENITITVNDTLLSITSFSPPSDPETELGTMQNFNIDLNRMANVTWYMNGTLVQTNISVVSANFTNSTAGVGKWNITASATDNIDTASKTWNWTVIPHPEYNVSGYVFDNFGSGLEGVLVQNESRQNTTTASGYYLIAGLINGTYNFSYSKAGFNTDYLEVTINGADNTSANKTIYDTTLSSSISSPAMTTGNFYVNNSWINPVDADYNYAWFSYSNDTTLTNVSKPGDYLNLTWSPHYTQNISAQTVDVYGNINETKVWFNTTIPNNVPIQSQIGNNTVDEGQWLNFTISATDADSDAVTYGTNATKGTFNATTGSFSWLTTYSDAGTYIWYFNSSDGYGGIAVENVTVTVNDTPLSIISSLPSSDPTTEQGTEQSFNVTLNRTANVTWYINDVQIQINTSVISASYTNSTVGTGIYNVTAAANDSYDSVTKSWNWTVVSQSVYNVSGYVFDNYGSGLSGALVQNGSYQNTTAASGYYLITGLFNGTYNFSYSKDGFNTDYLEITVNGADNISANKTLYDTTPSASVSNPATVAGNFYVNNTWTNPVDADYNYIWFKHNNGTTITNVSKPTNYLNLTWQPHYTQNISAQTVDNYSNVNQTMIWFNATILNNPPVQATIGNRTVYEGQWLNFTVNATDADNDTITYGTNATKGTFNTTTGNFSWILNYGDAGFYFWNFNSSDGYGGIVNENVAVTVINAPLSITGSSPAGDLTTTVGTSQTFGITLNRTASVTWYINGSIVQTNSSVMSADYTNSTAGIGEYNVTTIANDSYYSASRTWNWTVMAQPTYNVSGYVFDNYGSGLGDVLVLNESSQNTTLASGYYLITDLLNGTYNFSYSKPGFNTGYLEVTVNGADNTAVNKTIYDTTSPASVSNTTSATGNFYINNTWINPADADFNYIWFRYSNGTDLQNVSSPVSYLNLTWLQHYTQNISAQTVDIYGNINQTEVWFNATIPNNPPVQSLIGDQNVTAGSPLQFNVTATDADSDQITYGTNATNGTLNSTSGEYSWQTGISDAGTYTWYFNSSDSYGGIANETITVTVTVAPPSKYIPPAPVNLTSTQGNFWINNSWEAGAGNATDSYNVSVNGIWTNGTKNTYSNDTVGPHGWSNITVWAYNNSDGGSLSSAPVSQSTQVTNNAPLQTSIGNKSIDEGQWLNFTVNATDADNDLMIYGTDATKGSFDTTTGNFSWLTTYSDAGTYAWYFNSSDGYGDVASEIITVTVNNTPLSVTSFSPPSDPATTQGTAQTFNITLDRTANVTWYINGAEVQTDTGTTSASYTNSTAETGTWNVTASATDNIDTVSKSWNWTVNALPPTTYIPPDPTNLQNTTSGFWVNHTWLAGAGNTTDSYNVSVNGTWYNGTTDAFENSTTAPHGWVNITVWAYNSSGTGSLSAGSISQDTQVANNPPSQYLIVDNTIDEGQLLTFKVNTTDADNDTITYGTNATKGALNTTGDFSWVPAYGDAGIYTWYFNSSDGYGGVASETVTVTVNNMPLSITSSAPASDPISTAGTPQMFEITLNRTANITWYIDSSTAQTNSSTVSANYTNSTAGAGIYNITAVANDSYDSTTKQWNWTVVPQPVYAPGIISWSNNKTNNDSLTLAANTSETINFNATANQTITTWNWYQDNVNQNINYDNFTASWNTAGTKTVQVNATNNNGTSNTITWTVTVQAQPEIYVPPSPANINSTTGNFWVNATWEPGAGNTTDSYNVSVNGAWTNGTTSTYVNSPLSAHAWQNVTVYAYNASGSGSLSAIPAIKDTQVPNNPPVKAPIGNKSVDERQWLNFTVNATDVDNDLMTYGTNATKGNFNTTTGTFSWLTTYSDSGTYIWYFNSSDGYGGVTTETVTVNVNNIPLSITSSSPSPDQTTTQGTAQSFNIILNRTADITWYMNGTLVQTNGSVTSAVYTNSTAGIGTWNVTASATDGIDTVLGIWNWTVIAQPTYNVSGYVFDNYGSGLGGVQVQNDSKLSTTVASGYYLVTGLFNGTYNFSYTKAGFNTDYLEVIVNGADYTNANKTIYDTMPPARVTGLANDSPTQTTVNLTWNTTADANYYQVFRDSASLGYTQNNYWNDSGLTADALYGYTVRANDSYNWGQNSSTLNIRTAPAADTTPPASVSASSTATGNFYINNTWTNPVDADYSHAWFRYSNDTTLTNVSKPASYLNLTWQPHYVQNISAQTVDTFGNVNPAKVWFNVTIPNNAPAQSIIGNKAVDEGLWLNFTVSATDADTDTITYGTNTTKGTFDTATGNFSWHTTYSDAGTYTWYFNSTDGYGGVASETITVTVNNIPLFITSFSPPLDPITTQGTAQTFNITLNKTANITWYMNGAQVQTDTGTTSASYTNLTAGAGTWNVTASAADSIDTVSKTWNWTVNVQLPAAYVPPDPTNLQNTTSNFWVNHTWLPGTGNTTDSYNVSVNGTWYNMTTNTYYNNMVGPHGWSNITLWAYNSSGTGSLSAGSVSQNTQVPNNPLAQNPIENKNVTAGDLLTFTVSAMDADNDTITYGTNATVGTLDSTTGVYSWQTGVGDAGVYIWYFNSSDSYGGTANETITVTVTVAPPSKYIPPAPVNLTSTQGNFWINNSWEAGAGNTTDSYNVSVNGFWTNGTTNTYYNDTVGPHGWSNITVWAYNNSDGGSLSSSPVSQSTQVTNNAPLQTAIESKVINEGDLLAFNMSATDADNDTITYGTNSTKGSFNTITGNFSWMPGYGDAGIYTWYFNSSDNFGGITSETITVTVGNVPLSIAGSSPAGDPAIMIGAAQTFEIILNRTVDVTWYIDGSVAQTNSSTMSANYTNSTAGAGTYNVTVAATDGYDSTTKQWNWTVVPQPVFAPGIISWSNNKTNNNSLTLAANTSEIINFNATANQTITTWNWYLDSINQNNNYDNLTASWNTAGTKTVQVNATNNNGTSSTVTWTVTVQAQPEIYVPPSPANINSTTGNFWVNTTWEPGAGNTTDSYNVSVNGAWTNGTASTYVNSFLSAHAWQNVTVYAYNASGSGSLSASPAIKDTQVPNNPPVQSSIGTKSIDEGQWLNFTINTTDVDSDAITYGTNATKGDFNATTGNFSWPTTYSDAGVYIWYFNSSDGYGGVANETITIIINNTPLSITSFSPLSDPTTTQGTAQTFNVTLNRTANITWYMNGIQVQTDTAATSVSYTNSTAGAGTWNVTASATDGIDAVSKAWNWTVSLQPAYNVSGYVFDNSGSGLEGVLVQNGSYQSNTSASGYYLITGLLNGTYNFNYSRTGFNTGYLEVTINGADNTTANITIYDTTPPASISNIAATSAPLYINWTWADPSEPAFDHVAVYIDGTFMRNITKGMQFYNASYFMPNSTHTISTRTVDIYDNVNTTWINDTVTTPPDYAYISSFQNDTGTVSDFTSALNASDGGASATFTEANVSGTYYLNITTNTTDIPDAGIHTLQLMYNVSGDNFTLQVWNGTAWNNRTVLNDTSPSYRNITLMTEELIPEGASAGNAGSINRYYVLVRYLDLDESPAVQGTLYLDYQRVYSE